jgi:ornithine cyclodeaminase/alanine dehydrogenase-like protein (mu-crystallin family)
MIVLDEAAVCGLLPMPVAIRVTREVMAAFSAREVTQPVRTVLQPRVRDGADPGLFGVMPAHVPVRGNWWFGVKSVVVKEGNPRRGLDTHVGVVTVFDPASGLPAAVMPASAITAIRTAAASAVATDVLARSDAATLAVLGAGVQARSHVRAMLEVRPVREVRLWNRNRDRARDLSELVTAELGVPALCCDSIPDATKGADLICTTTAAKHPILTDTDLDLGTHVNAVGSCQPDARELSSELIQRSAVFVDSLEAAAREAAELLVPQMTGLIGKHHARAEIGSVIGGTAPGRRAADEITVYLSLGIAAQDVAAAVVVAERAIEQRAMGTR